ncbi:MAG: precorrin-3B C(17)-methyltransferase [bacterium]
MTEKGRLSVIGLGPGKREYFTLRGLQALEESEVIIGYERYTRLVRDFWPGRKVLSSGMRKELARCREALSLAREGKRVALICGGDPGIYGLAGPALELLLREKEHEENPTGTKTETRTGTNTGTKTETGTGTTSRIDTETEAGIKAGTDTGSETGTETGTEIEIEIVPGLSAVSAAASILGAPLMNDMAIISLSDLLTPWPVIEKRLKAAAEADFVTALYNPKSIKRTSQILETQAIFLQFRSPDTPVGVVHNALRDEEERKIITTLQEFTKEEITMLSLVIIGNSQTRTIRGKIITPRGYERVYDLGK